MRFRLAAGQSSSVYRPGQFVSASYATRYPHKVSTDEPPPDDDFDDDVDDFPEFDWEILIVFDY